MTPETTPDNGFVFRGNQYRLNKNKPPVILIL